jgi:hypothetical protein
MVCVQALHQEHSLTRIHPNDVELCTMDASEQNLRIHPDAGGDGELLDLRTMLMWQLGPRVRIQKGLEICPLACNTCYSDMVDEHCVGQPHGCSCCFFFDCLSSKRLSVREYSRSLQQA